MPERRRARVLVVTPGNTYLEAALLLDEYLDVTLLAPSKYPPADSYDVTIFDGVAPPLAEAHRVPRSTWRSPDAGRAGQARQAHRDVRLRHLGQEEPAPALDGARRHPGRAAARRSSREQGDRVIGASDHGPILVAGRRAGRKFVALGFDPRDSDFVLRVAWPLFVLNTINDFVEEDTGYVSSFRTGEVWQHPGAERAPRSRRSRTRAAEAPRSGQGRPRRVPRRAGGLLQAQRRRASRSRSTTMFAANLADLEESRIEPKHELALGGRPRSRPPASRPACGARSGSICLAAVILVSVLEWITYHRRITV